MTAPLEADKELDEIINQGNCDYPKEVKAALLAWRDKAVIEELGEFMTKNSGPPTERAFIELYNSMFEARLSKLKAIMEIKE